MLAPGGKVALQAITLPHERMLATRNTHTFITKYIFPGGALPSVAAIDEVADEVGLVSVDDVGLGADYALVGRAYMYGLMAGGQRGVTRMLDLMHTSMRRTMRLVGVNAIDDLTPEHVNLMTPQPARGHWV